MVFFFVFGKIVEEEWGEVGTKYRVAKGFITTELSLELLLKQFSQELKFISQIKKFGVLCLN